MNDIKYQQQYGTLSASGVGVVATRTREPFRAIQALRNWAFSKDLPFGTWNVRDGWVKQGPMDDPDATPKKDGIIDVYMALKLILDVDGSGKSKWTRGVFVMHAVHHWFKHPGVIECLRHYVRDLAEEKALRLVLVLPEITILPEDLKHDIPLLDYDLPDREELAEIFDYVIESSTPTGEEPPEMFTKELREIVIGSSGGMTQMEAEVAFSKGIVLQRPSWPNIAFDQYNHTVLEAKTEIVKNSEVLEMMSAVPMEDVGGLEIYKEWISECAPCFSQEARDFGVDAPKGVVAIGPPGTGKSLIAKATGSALNMPILKFDVSRVYGSLVGQSEERARSAIKMCEAAAPCIVLIDEIDKGLGGSHKGGGDSGVSMRVLGAILTAMQESKAPIFWIASANRVDGLPPELLRKGRFDEVFAVLPPNDIERAAIFEIHLRKRKQNIPRADLQLAIDASEGYVGSECEAAVKEAVKKAFVTNTKVTGFLIAEQLAFMKPLKEAFPEDFANMAQWAQNNARMSSAPSSSAVDIPEGPVRIRRRSVN